MTYKISPIDDCLAFESQELEKLAILPQLPKYLDDVYKGHVGLATVNRGDLGDAGYPFEQRLGENVQNTLIDGYLLRSDLKKTKTWDDYKPWDYLIGQRAWSTREVVLKDGFRMRPSDLVLSRFEYTDGYKEEDRKYKKESHGEGVYMNIALAMILGVEVSNVRLEYKHDSKQKALEEFKEVWAEKRIGHATSIPDQVFDVVANYIDDQEGFTKKIERFITNGSPIELKHYAAKHWLIGQNGMRESFEDFVDDFVKWDEYTEDEVSHAVDFITTREVKTIDGIKTGQVKKSINRLLDGIWWGKISGENDKKAWKYIFENGDSSSAAGVANAIRFGRYSGEDLDNAWKFFLKHGTQEEYNTIIYDGMLTGFLEGGNLDRALEELKDSTEAATEMAYWVVTSKLPEDVINKSWDIILRNGDEDTAYSLMHVLTSSERDKLSKERLYDAWDFLLKKGDKRTETAIKNELDHRINTINEFSNTPSMLNFKIQAKTFLEAREANRKTKLAKIVEAIKNDTADTLTYDDIKDLVDNGEE